MDIAANALEYYMKSYGEDLVSNVLMLWIKGHLLCLCVLTNM